MSLDEAQQAVITLHYRFCRSWAIEERLLKVLQKPLRSNVTLTLVFA